MNLVTEYPFWYVVGCLALGFAFAFLLYFRSKHLTEMARWKVRSLFGIRWLLVSAIAFLLLKPLLTTLLREVEKPIIVFIQDDSESIVIGQDSNYLKSVYPNAVKQFLNKLSEQYDLATFSFSNKVTEDTTFSFSGKETDISVALDEVYTRFSNRNLGAVVMASDGILNRGLSPIYASRKLKAPIYTIALGDTAIKKDLIIGKVAHNRLAYLGNAFPMEISIDARKCAGEKSELSIIKNGEVLFSEAVEVKGDVFQTTIPFQLDATETGIQRYEIVLKAVEDEISRTNNRKEVFIDILDGRQKILVLANSPHPDVSALVNSLRKNINYEVETATAKTFKGNPDSYNLLVLHQLPSAKYPISNVLQKAEKEDIPILFMVGGQSSLSQFNRIGAGLTINTSRVRSNETQGLMTEDFALFTLSKEMGSFVKKLPPLSSPFGNYELATGATTLLKQQIGLVETEYPLISFSNKGEAKIGVISGEGIWRWKLFNFAETGNHEYFDELLGKTIQYLAVKEDKSLFRVYSKNNFLENESVFFEAEVYNESYELITEPAVTMEITDAEGKVFPFEFSPTPRNYILDAGVLPVGRYSYKATVSVGNETFTETGEFSVSPVQVEAANTIADHQMLYQLAEKSSGEMLYPEGLQNLADKLLSREDIRPVTYTRKELNDLINLKWIFFILLALLSLEWYVRKRNGAY